MERLGLLLGPIVAGVQGGLAQAFSTDAQVAQMSWHAVVALIATVPSVGYWVIFVALGWPILIDCIRILNVKVPEWIVTDRTRKILLAVAVVAALSQGVVSVGLAAFNRF